MEEGSLLQEALNYMDKLRTKDADDHSMERRLQNVLQMDVYDLEQPPPVVTNDTDPTLDRRIACFQRLTELATKLNAAFRSTSSSSSSNYPWAMGGDGPVFGIHTSQGIPHLRGQCRYGFNVLDEWRAVQIVLEFTQRHENVAVDCWDLDDGPLFLVECAEELPHWLQQDDGGLLDPRHMCWIVNGQLRLVGPDPQLSLSRALQQLSLSLKRMTGGDDADESTTTTLMVSTVRDMNRHLDEHLRNLFSNPKDNESSSSFTTTTQRTAALLPRPIAWMLYRRPDLISCLANSFETSSQNPIDNTTAHLQHHEHWVWTTLVLPRVHYSMLRTLVTSSTWRSEGYIPPIYKTPELKRLLQQTRQRRETAPHLQHAVQIGVRLTASLDYITGKSSRNSNNKSVVSPTSDMKSKIDSNNNTNTSLMERRILEGWARIDRESGGNAQWLMQAWQAGPNHARYDLSPFSKCLVFESEIYNNENDMELLPCPRTHPGETLQYQVQAELKRTVSKKEEAMESSVFVMPRDEDVDGDDWLIHGDSKMEEYAASRSSQAILQEGDEGHHSTSDQEQLGSMLKGLHNFMDTKSEIEGVSHDKTNWTSKSGTDTSEGTDSDHDPRQDLGHHQPADINPRVFLNMLHAVLKSTPEEISNFDNTREQDKFFSEDDYRLMDADSSDDSFDSEDDIPSDSREMNMLMVAMDEELRQMPGASRMLDDVGGDTTNDEEVAEDMHVLSNLLQSLDASGGAPGPVRNMLREMGADPPKVVPEVMSDHEDDNYEDE